MQLVTAEFRKGGGRVVEPRRVTDEELLRIHDADHIGVIKETPPDDRARRRHLRVQGELRRRLPGRRRSRECGRPSARRPAWHACLRARAAAAASRRAQSRDGFCFFNNIGVAAAHARARGLSRVAVVDYDVHHGNGTQWSFYDDPSVLFVSSHQYPFYPGRAPRTTSAAAAAPASPSTCRSRKARAMRTWSARTRRSRCRCSVSFKPELILISAGFDAHVDDPLGGLAVSAAYFGRLTGALAAIADECCGGQGRRDHGGWLRPERASPPACA
jgi:acetoin utilization deacetylase AcuC-like enzyme